MRTFFPRFFELKYSDSDREAVKHIVLDCPASLAKQILIKHVQTILLGKLSRPSCWVSSLDHLAV
jgi:hypothetical protein